MLRGTIGRSTVGLVTLVTVTMAVAAWAHGPSHDGVCGPGLLEPRPGGSSGGLLLELIYPCQFDGTPIARSATA